MSKTGKAMSILIVAILATSVGTTAFYFNGLIEDRNSRISSLESQVENQTTELDDLKSQISTLQSQLTNLTSVYLVTSLGISEVGNSSLSIQKPEYYRLYISGSIINKGNGTAIKAGLNVLAYEKNGTLEINMTVPFVTGAEFSSLINLDGTYPGGTPWQFTNLSGGETANVDLNIFHNGHVTNWTVTPVSWEYLP